MEIDALAISEAARRLAISSRTIHRLIQRGELPSILIGRRRLIRRSSLADWLAGREQHQLQASADRLQVASGGKSC